MNFELSKLVAQKSLRRRDKNRGPEIVGIEKLHKPLFRCLGNYIYMFLFDKSFHRSVKSDLAGRSQRAGALAACTLKHVSSPGESKST